MGCVSSRNLGREGVFHGFIICAINSDAFVQNPNAVAVLAKEHAPSEAGAHTLEVGWNVEDAGGEQQASRAIGAFAPLKVEHLRAPACLQDFIRYTMGLAPSGLLLSALQQFPS